MKKLLIFALFLIVAININAKEHDSILHRIFPFLHVEYDTAFVVDANRKLTFKPYTSVNKGFTTFTYTDTIGNDKYNFTIGDRGGLETGLGISYKGFSFSYGINPKEGFGFIKKNEFNYIFSAYGSKVGCDFFFKTSGKSKVTTENNKHPLDDYTDCITSSRLQASAFVVIKGERVSLPAVFNQSFIQKKSAGSMLASVMISNTIINFDKDAVPSQLDSIMSSNKMFYHFRKTMLGVSIGYGFNGVVKNFLFHVSGQPSLPLYMGSQVRFVDGTTSSKDDWGTNIGFKFRTAVIWQHKHHCFDFNMVVDALFTSQNNLNTNDTFFRGFLGYTYRF